MNMFNWAKKANESFEKDRSIKELKAVFPDIRRPNNDNSLFEVLFDVQGHYSTLKIFIPTDYPAAKPVLQVMGPLMHPWLDEYKQVIGGEKLLHWSKTSSLADLVSTTLLSLQTGINQNKQASQRNLLARPTQTHNAQLSASNSTSSLAMYPGAAYTQQQSQPKQESAARSAATTGGVEGTYKDASSGGSNKPPPPSYQSVMKAEVKPPTATPSAAEKKGGGIDFHVDMPEIPSAFPELRELSEVQLERLLQDSEALYAHMVSQAQVDHILSLRDDIRQSNKQQCLATMAIEGGYSEEYEKYSALQSQLRSSLKDYKERLAAVTKKCSFTKTDFQKKVDKKMDAMDDQCESLVRSFSSDSNLHDFLTEYLRARTEFHAVSLKAAAIA